MPSNRRFKATVLFAALAFIIILYVTSASQRTKDSPFYTRTSEALSLREQEEAGGRAIESDDASVQKSLREAADAAKKVAEKKAMDFHGEDGKQKAEEVKSKLDRENALHVKDSDSDSQNVVAADTAVSEEAEKAKAELDYILKRSKSMSPSTILLVPPLIQTLQSSYSPKPTALIQRKPKTFFSTNTRLLLLLTW